MTDSSPSAIGSKPASSLPSSSITTLCGIGEGLVKSIVTLPALRSVRSCRRRVRSGSAASSSVVAPRRRRLLRLRRSLRVRPPVLRFAGLRFRLLLRSPRFRRPGAAFVGATLAFGLGLFDLFAGLLELGRLRPRASSSWAWRTAKVVAPPTKIANQSDDQRHRPAREVLQFQADEADDHGRDGEDAAADVEEGLVAHDAAVIL